MYFNINKLPNFWNSLCIENLAKRLSRQLIRFWNRAYENKTGYTKSLAPSTKSVVLSKSSKVWRSRDNKRVQRHMWPNSNSKEYLLSSRAHTGPLMTRNQWSGGGGRDNEGGGERALSFGELKSFG